MQLLRLSMSLHKESGHTMAQQQYRVLHDIYVLLDDGDRRVFQSFALTTSQYAVLMLLDECEGCRLTTVSDRLLLARSTITRIIDQLERAGLVWRAADPHDRRAQRAILTPAGATRRDEAHEAHRRSLERRMQALDSAEHAHLQELLDKLRAGLQADLKAF